MSEDEMKGYERLLDAIDELPPEQTTEGDYPLAETPRLRVAYLLWQANEGYILAEDRAVSENWMLGDPRDMHEDDARDLPGWLDMADAVLTAIDAEVVNPPGATK